MSDDMNWVDEEETKRDEEFKKGYFNIVKGDNRVQLLTHCAKLVQVWDNAASKYRIAKEGDKDPNIKGLCWVLHDGYIKEAKLPYTVVRQIRTLRNDPDWAFEKFPMPRLINIKAEDNGKKFNGKVVFDYTVMPSPKEAPVNADILSALAEKPTPETMIEKMKERATDTPPAAPATPAQGYPTEEEEGISRDGIPF